MLVTNFKILIAIILITIYCTQTEATKCGDFFCEGNSECLLNKEKTRLECNCEMGFVAEVIGNIYNCHQITPSNDETKCLRIGDKCGPEHTCSVDLICEKTKVIDLLECSYGVAKCFDTCCQANEVCLEHKCVAKPPAAALNTDCPKSSKCLDKCCAANEVCSAEYICVLMENFNETAKLGQSALKECRFEQICLNVCCKETEKCSQENECVAKERLEGENTFVCPKNRTCFDGCCAENEICEGNSKCVAAVLLESECPEHQKCQGKCCPPTQFCFKEVWCVDDFAYSSTDAAYTTFSTGYSVLWECPLAKQCSGTCCGDQEKCSQFNVCTPINSIECSKTEICGEKCCPINETCNLANECVAFIEATLIDNCPENQQCLRKCCNPSEICNEFYQCVIDESYNYDITYLESSVTEPNFDATLHLFELENHENQEQTIRCAEDYLLCENKCCHLNETCSSAGECTELVAEITNSLPYTIIGLGCLVMILSFALFKVYAFRRSNGILY